MLDEIQTLGISRGSPTNYVINLDIIIFFADTTTVHGVGKLHEDGILLHDALDVLSSDANDTLVVLIRDVKGDGGRHFLLHKIEPILGSFVLGAADVDVEIVFVEAVEDDLHIT